MVPLTRSPNDRFIEAGDDDHTAVTPPPDPPGMPPGFRASMCADLVRMRSQLERRLRRIQRTLVEYGHADAGPASPPVTPMLGPWHRPELAGWAIVGMNHYYVSGARRLFVAMTRGNFCIAAEGADDAELWNDLARKAEASNG